MIFTDLYILRDLTGLKSKRYDCIASTGEYEPLQAKYKIGRDKIKRLYCYFGEHSNSKSIGEMKLADGRANWTKVKFPDNNFPNIGLGDMNGTDDEIIVLFSEQDKKIELLIARGLKKNRLQLYWQFVEGELDDEVERLRQQATPTNAE